MKKLFLSLLAFGLSTGAAGAVFYAASGKVEITPDLKRERIYLAGYGAKGRRAKGVKDGLYARALIFSDGKRTVALVAVDSIGIARQDVLDLRRMLGWTGGDKYLFVGATHNHSAPDTLGLWGPLPGISGINKRYHKRLKWSIVDLVKDLSTRLQEAELHAARTNVDPRGLCRDSRDPIVIDPELNVLQARTLQGKPIGTLVRWSCHPEVIGPDNNMLTADFPGALCRRIEFKTEGACVFFPGSIGGLLGPDVEHTFKASKELGEKIAARALSALKKPSVYRNPLVRFSSAAVRIPVDNSRYLIFLRSLVFGHKLYDESGAPLPAWKSWWYPIRHLAMFPLPKRLRPWIETEISLVRIGPVKILGVPGEIFPELVIGGYDGKYRYGSPLVGPTNKNPPDLKSAPKPPYLRKKLNAWHGLVIGLANDEIGYIVPEYDFQIAPTRSLTPKPEGTHYEETNSIGRRATPILLEAYDKLLGR